MSFASAASLLVIETAEGFLAKGLEVAEAVGLPVSTWRAGDPTRTGFKFLAESLATLEQVAGSYIASAWLSTARKQAEDTGDSTWLKIVAEELYGVIPDEAEPATGQVTLVNSGGGFYALDAGDIRFTSTATGKTYHSTSATTINAGATVTVDFEADEAGSASTLALDELDGIETTLLGVAISTSTAATGSDEASPAEIETQCRATLGALSPNGPPDAYEYVVLNSALTGVTDIERARSSSDSTTGEVTVYVASLTGPVAGASVTAAQTAVEQWATPRCITPTVVNATAHAIAVTYTVSGDDIPGTFEDLASDALDALLSTIPISDGTTLVARSAIIAAIQDTLVANGAKNLTVAVSVPASDVVLAVGEVSTSGVYAGTEV